ncbi:unnamed protein product [Oppiella nova]|uniref:AMP-dependent synthetase/ligase domain-containing protein n=1 Tax=Oppiella nova TaxID=334625 RepID=A0A7R9LU57_9ACAR|nr:unnamed protein product [Oppiella nova]CAG2166689.1 unnamed protein product [Oppiella nova]
MIEYQTQRSFTFNQLADDCLRAANVWKDIGLRVGQTFGICGHNSYEYMVCFLSGIIIGAIAIPMRGTDTIDEFKRTLKEREISLIALSGEKLRQIKSHDFYDNIMGIVFGSESDHQNETHFWVYENLISSTRAISEDLIHEPKDVMQDICLILESSGTTGLPKGCMFSHYNLVSLVTIGSLVYNRTAEDIVSGHSYMAHISGVNQLIMSINNGSQLVLHPVFNLNTLFEAIEKHGITALSAPASVYMTLLKAGTEYDISTLRKLICGGAPLPKGCAQQIAHKYPHFEDFRQSYGMTEMTILIAFGHYGRRDYESVGDPTPGNRIKVIDCTTGEVLPPNCNGEICVTGPTLFKGI